MTIRYRIQHETVYRYAAPVALAQQVLHLVPRACAWQRILASDVQVTPQPLRRVAGTDPFGNPELRVAVETPHDSLQVVSRLEVEVGPRPWAGRRDDGPPWETVRALLLQEGDAPLEALQYRFESPHVRVKNELAAWARQDFLPGVPLLAAVRALVARIHREFRYDPQATEVGTPVLEVYARRRGVCQDFAHLAISCLRSLGLSARYVSGYLSTAPPPGQPRLTGADASHAWLAVWCPGAGWVEFDPTNDTLADQRHVVLAWGRDFGDVSPLRGVIQGGGAHDLRVAVTVTPAGE